MQLGSKTLQLRPGLGSSLVRTSLLLMTWMTLAHLVKPQSVAQDNSTLPFSPNGDVSDGGSGGPVEIRFLKHPKDAILSKIQLSVKIECVAVGARKITIRSVILHFDHLFQTSRITFFSHFVLH